VKLKSFHFIIISIFLLTACGGGSDGSGELKTGQFFDSPVSGLAYETSSGLSGTTGPNGEFQYRDGETVTFKLGKTVLGSARGSSRITPFDLFFITPPLGSEFLEELGHLFDSQPANAFEHTVNMLIFLQSLDVDDNPDNGIDIPPAVANFFLLIAEAILFDQDNDEFAAAFLVLFLEIVQQGILERNADTKPVDYRDAIKHFYKELGEDIPL